MRALATALLVAAFAALYSTSAAAQTAHVPTDYATIQAALNSGATLVYVAQGSYPETLDVQRTVTLLPEPPADPRSPHPFPHVYGMKVRHLGVYSPNVYVRGFRFSGPVSHTNSMTRTGITIIEGCRLDMGFWTYGQSGLDESIKIRSCVITGDVFLYSYYNEFTGNMLWKGKADIHSNGANGATIRDNLVIGPSTHGLLSTSPDSPGLMSGNTVSGVGTAFTIMTGTVLDNVAQDCVTGFTCMPPPGGPRTYQSNQVRRCVTGFELLPNGGHNSLLENDIDSVTSVGIHVGASTTGLIEDNVISVTGSHGIWLEGYGTVSGNRVLYAGADGIRSTRRADWNVVGRSQGNGITAPSARNNTVFLNGGIGLSLNSSVTDTVSNNISYGNIGYGLRWSGTGSALLRCNDWFGNIGGATQGVSPGLTDLAVNPQFCNLTLNRVHLSASSPLLSAPHCGQVGALGLGCFSAVGVPETGAAPARFSVRPNPASSIVDLEWAAGSSPTAVEVFDVTGAVRFRTELPVGVHTLRWTGRDSDGRELPRGVYFVRRTSGEQHQQTRVVLRD